MANIYVNYGSFNDWASKISNKNDELKDKLSEIRKLINSLEGEWESDSAKTIREKINGMQSRFDQYYDVVDNYAIFLRNTAKQYSENEATQNKKAQQFI